MPPVSNSTLVHIWTTLIGLDGLLVCLCVTGTLSWEREVLVGLEGGSDGGYD